MNALWQQILLWTLTAVSLLGTALNVWKLRSCFYVWAFANVAWACVDISLGLWSRLALDLVHLAFAVWGAVAWRKP